MTITYQTHHKDMPFKPTFLGFSSLQDLCTSVLGLKYAAVHAVVVAFFTLLTSFISLYIWDSPEAVYTLWSLMLFDYFTGILKAIRGKRFASFKLFRMPIFFVVTTAILSLSFWMAQSSIVFILLPTIVMAGFMSVYAISLIENLGELGWLPKPIVKLLKNKFGLEALIKKNDWGNDTTDNKDDK
jgi:phage-related holin